MLMKPEPLVSGIEALAGERGGDRAARVVMLSPQGRPLTQEWLATASRRPHWVIVCGRYEGVDQRVIDLAVDEEVSIGDYVLSGGEVPAMVLIEGMIRLLPGLLGNADSVDQESFAQDILEGPQYTRPPEFRGRCVPQELLSGNHAVIERWRRERAIELTRRRRPDLLRDPAGSDADEGSGRLRARDPSRLRRESKASQASKKGQASQKNKERETESESDS